jgi:DNA-binding MarR family transcriptional regulator
VDLRGPIYNYLMNLALARAFRYPVAMDTKIAIEYVREFLRIYWANEHAHEAWSRELESRFGITSKQYALLRAIERSADITTTLLTELMGKAQPAITQMLNRLERNGFITREINPADKRKRELRVTESAQRVLREVEPVGATRVALALEHASEREAEQIIDAIALIHEWMTQRPVRDSIHAGKRGAQKPQPVRGG